MGSGKPRSQKTVLVVDDQPEVRKALRHILERRGGYSVAEADDVETALEVVREQAPNAMVLDISMPGRPGFTILAELRAMSVCTKILVLSSHEDMGDEMKTMGADAFLPKTSPPRTVLETLATILG